MKVLALATALLGCLGAYANSPTLTSTTPAGAQRGTEVELRLNGRRLETARELIFYSAGFKLLSLDTAKTNSVKARVQIAPDCALGEHQLRVRTDFGLSELRLFFVSATTNLAEVEPNNETAKAQVIPNNVTVEGSVGGDDVDFYRVSVSAGDTLSAEVEAIRLGRALLDPHLSILSEKGEVLAQADDVTLLQQDSAVSIVAPASGNYFIAVRDSTYGGSESTYRLHVGSFPRPLAVYPSGGPAGKKLAVQFLGGAEGAFEEEVMLPEVARDEFPIFAHRNKLTAPSPNFLRVSPFPNVLEVPPNQSREQATSGSGPLPLAFNGIIQQAGEADWFRFTAKKGEALEASVFARRLRSPLDSVLTVYDAKGNAVGSNDDAAGIDSVVKFTPAADGDYFLKVEDQLKRGSPLHVYRVEVAPAQPSVVLSIPQVARNDSQTRQYIIVPRGNRFATMINAKRSGFSGDLGLIAEGLPQGVQLHAEPLVGKVELEPIVFEAAPDAAIGGNFIDLLARSTDASKPMQGRFQHQIDFVNGPNNTFYCNSRVDKLYVAVTEAAPFKLRIEEPKVPLVQSGTMALGIVAERAPGFDGPINVKMMWNPPGVGSQPDIVIAKGATNATYQLNANGGAELRKWKIAVLGSATVNEGTVWASSQLAPIEIAEPYLTLKIETTAIEPGETARIICKLDQKHPFTGPATIRLMGLPEKLSAAERTFTAQDKEVIFEVPTNAKTPIGSHRNLFCTVDVVRDGDAIPHSLGNGGVLRIVPPKKSAPAKVASLPR